MSRLTFRLAALAVLTAAPASAQFFDGPGPYRYNNPPPIWPFEAPDERVRPLSPVAIVNRLEDQGFDDVGRPRFDGSTYVIDATAPNGRRVRLVVDAFRGRLIDRRPLGRGPDWDDEDGPRRAFGRADPFPPEMPEAEQRRLERGPGPIEPRRQAARPIEPSPQPRALRPPADVRVAPGPNEVARPAEGRPVEGRAPAPERREAARPEPSAGKPYGVNPDTPGARRRPAETAKPAPAPSPAAPPKEAAAVAAPGAAPPPKAEASADPERASKPVRVIGGVTPMNPASAPPTPSGPTE